jgi:2-polyprenyl-3-methyl-5-hydroxy-6-metoxy-1,4-benzoquinol methylase
MNLLVNVLGFPATLIHGDMLVLDRWNWLKKRIPANTSNATQTLLDVGCGSGAFTIGMALRGYNSLGLSWDKRNQDVAELRANLCHADKATFLICDVRDLDKERTLYENFDVVICTENIEHIIGDQKLMIDMQRCLKPGGKLFLTTPNDEFIPMFGDKKQVSDPPVEDGGHVKIGYNPEEFRTLCSNAGLVLDEVSYCSGYLSQQVTSLFRRIIRLNFILAWAITLPLRILPPVFDRFIPYTGYSICLVAHKA